MRHAEASKRPPNIVLILVDDLGWADLGSYGSTFHRTPHIDELVTAKLRESGLLENTVVFFTSDNGGLSVREGPDTPATSNAPLREGKGYLYEGGIRVPLIAYWEGVTRPGVVCRTPVTGADLFPTVAEIARLGRPAGADGVSLLPLLKGAGAPRREALYWHYPHYSNQGGTPGGAIRRGDYKLIEFFDGPPPELYDLARDPGESVNLAGRMPRRAGELKGMLERWRARVGAQMMRPNPEYGGAAASRPGR